ncbi:hypothetical protein DFH08DRAFT_964339 [Mycena albidolilacea]|uniref:Uncharacterized protein n=1 Tax=Mycena albidolilacea TaxID=1033008 RepID=A0AAD7ELG1_9AGAR|nr:hypothetical protein DFH08DRAFT_964339 [Mycena albidolilacea]
MNKQPISSRSVRHSHRDQPSWFMHPPPLWRGPCATERLQHHLRATAQLLSYLPFSKYNILHVSLVAIPLLHVHTLHRLVRSSSALHLDLGLFCKQLCAPPWIEVAQPSRANGAAHGQTVNRFQTDLRVPLSVFDHTVPRIHDAFIECCLPLHGVFHDV